jgi:tetratricopeptide (TPR) repeat protein
MGPRLATLILIALAVSLAVRAQEDVPEVARSLMEEAEHAKEAGRPEEAISKYRRVLELAPSLASAYVNLGALYYSQGKIDDAYGTFARGVEVAPADRILLTNAAAAAQQLGKSLEALAYVDRALEKHPRDATLYSIRATVLRSLGKNDDALAALQQAVQIAPDDPKLLFSLGNLFYQAGKRDDAVAAYRRAIELDRSYLRAYYNLGAVLFESGRYDEALQAYRVALEPIEQSFARRERVDPMHSRAFANLGAIYLNQKQYDQAREAYQKTLRLDPNDALAHYNLGFIEYSTGKLDRAEEEYRKALARDPSLPLAYLHLGDIAYRRGDTEKAIQLLGEGLPRFNRESKLRALRIMGHAQLARSDRRGARASFEEALREEPNDAEALLYLGHIARLDRRPQEAKPLLARAQQLSPDDAAVALERVLAARDADDLAEERAAIESSRTDLAPLRAELVVVLLRQNAIEDARRALAATKDPSLDGVRAALEGRSEARDASASPTGRGNSGLLLWQRGRMADARPHLVVAHNALPDWNEVTIALAEVALTDRRFADAANLLTSAKCESPRSFAVSGRTLQTTVGKSDDFCPRLRRDLTMALLGQAAEEIASGSPGVARSLLERASSMALDNRLQAIALFLRGTADLMSGVDPGAAREALSRATTMGLPPAAEEAARKNMAAPTPEPVTHQRRNTVVVFLPDAPVESDQRLAETVSAIVSQIATESGVPLQTEFFRRADDARAFVAGNRDRIGLVLSNPEFIATLGGELSSRFQFSREGRRTYQRVIVVPENSSVRSLNDLRGRTVSGVDVLPDAGVGTPVHVSDDLTAIANALYGQTDAAFVSEANPLLAQHARELRTVYSSTPLPLPVVAFAPMPEADRKALTDAIRGLSNARSLLAPLQMTALASIDRPEMKHEIATVQAGALGLRPPEPPASVALRVAIELPRIEIPEPKLP